MQPETMLDTCDLPQMAIKPIAICRRYNFDRLEFASQFRTAALLSMLLVLLGTRCTSANEFDSGAGRILAVRCLECHSSTEKKGGLDLSTEKSARAGGDTGAAIISGQLAESLIWERISKNEMPPKRPLNEAEKKILKIWIESGAKWGSDPIDPFRYSSDQRAGLDWWSLQPVQRPPLPAVSNQKWCSNPIDHFIFAGLADKGLTPNPEAEKRILIRRLSFDLLGLPPAPNEVVEFVSSTDPDAYRRLIDRYLESPQYGERWGRHWLDVVRFGESQGFERDKLRSNSWPYRDWVISALNDDLPYDDFVRRQVAGDVLFPHDPRGTIATGFLVAAPWDEVGQSQQSAAMRAVVRQDEIEDLMSAVGQTFLGLTINCARCHDHKFDPVSQTEYYQLASTLAGSRHGERDSLASAPAEQKIVERQMQLAEQERRLRDLILQIDAPVRQQILDQRKTSPAPKTIAPPPIARWEFEGDLNDSIGQLHGIPHGNVKIEQGRLWLDGVESYVETPSLQKEIGAKTLEVWLTLSSLNQAGGGAMTIQSSSGAIFDSIVFAERDPKQWMAGSNGYVRWQSFQAPQETSADRELVNMTIVYGADKSITAYRNGHLYGAGYAASSLAIYEANRSNILFGLRHSPPGGNRHLAASIDRAALFDRALTTDEVAALAGVTSNVVSDAEIVGQLSPNELVQRRQWQYELSKVYTEQRLISGGRTYAVAPSAPEPTFRLARGNPAQRQELVGPAGLRAIAAVSADFGLSADAPDAERRKKLAQWLTDIHNPLTPRVMANRIWHYHFGSGLVETPNDFGFNGGRPSHPQLLDWLAVEFVSPTPVGDSRPTPWSLKHLHRLIVNSSTYRQSSRQQDNGMRIDANNRLLWRVLPRRLEAEVLRDSMLFVSGQLNPEMGGPGFQDFKTFNFNSQFYEPIDPIGYEFNRRTIYRTWVRSGRNEFLDVFDCPDPSTAAPRRAVTTTPLQALSLLNNSFTFRMADALAARLAKEIDMSLEQRIAQLYRLAYNRDPDADEQAGAKQYAARHGLAALCRVVFNSNEFLYVD